MNLARVVIVVISLSQLFQAAMLLSSSQALGPTGTHVFDELGMSHYAAGLLYLTSALLALFAVYRLRRWHWLLGLQQAVLTLSMLRSMIAVLTVEYAVGSPPGLHFAFIAVDQTHELRLFIVHIIAVVVLYSRERAWLRR